MTLRKLDSFLERSLYLFLVSFPRTLPTFSEFVLISKNLLLESECISKGLLIFSVTPFCKMYLIACILCRPNYVVDRIIIK